MCMMQRCILCAICKTVYDNVYKCQVYAQVQSLLLMMNNRRRKTICKREIWDCHGSDSDCQHYRYITQTIVTHLGLSLR
jgi:hypothetical protein